MFLSEWREYPSAPCLAGKENLMTARASMLLKSRASLTCFRACFLPGRAKDLSAPRYLTSTNVSEKPAACSLATLKMAAARPSDMSVPTAHTRKHHVSRMSHLTTAVSLLSRHNSWPPHNPYANSNTSLSYLKTFPLTPAKPPHGYRC